jgi:hypothetical protein
MVSLTDFFQPQVPQEPSYQQTLSLADLALQRDLATPQTRLEQGILTRNFRTRTIPSIVNARAAKGGFFSGQTALELGQAAEDTQTDVGRLEFAHQNLMQDLLRQQYKTALGLTL